MNGGSQIDCIPNAEEKYISFSKSIYDDEKKFKYKIRLIDSVKFMPTSFDKLVNNLNENQLKHAWQAFGDDCELLLRKGVYPYDCADCLDKLDEKRLPPKEAIYSKLNDSDITDEHAQRTGTF